MEETLESTGRRHHLWPEQTPISQRALTTRRKHRCLCLSTRIHRSPRKSVYPAPALLHHLTAPSSPPVTYAPAVPCVGGFGLHETDHTSPCSCTVETAALAAISQTLVVLSADPETASLPSGEMSVLRTQEECPLRVATAPEPGLPEDDTRTSCKIRRLSSDADRSSYSKERRGRNHVDGAGPKWKRTVESADQAKDRTAIACELYATCIEFDAMSKTKICPASDDMATRDPSGL